MQRDVQRDLAEAQDSIDHALYHMHWFRMSLIRARHYIAEAQNALDEGKGQDKGKGKGKSKDGKGKGKDNGEEQVKGGFGKGKDKGKGYGKATSSHNLRILLIYLLRSL